MNGILKVNGQRIRVLEIEWLCFEIDFWKYGNNKGCQTDYIIGFDMKGIFGENLLKV